MRIDFTVSRHQDDIFFIKPQIFILDVKNLLVNNNCSNNEYDRQAELKNYQTLSERTRSRCLYRSRFKYGDRSKGRQENSRIAASHDSRQKSCKQNCNQKARMHKIQ